MTSALIIILREVLEAMLIISLLLAASGSLGIHRRWIAVAIVAGLLGAGLYAYSFDAVTDSFDGVGQEIANAATLFAICLCLSLFSLFTVTHLAVQSKSLPQWVGLVALVGSIGLAIIREGAEITIYLSGYLLSPEPIQPIIIGGLLGAGIGLSAGALTYYALKIAKRSTSLLAICIILVPVGAGMVSQGVTYLIQADILPSQLPLWDSSMLVQESSVMGELLYALFSYEATPTPLQVEMYIATAVLMVFGMLLMTWLDNGDKSNTPYA